MTLPLVAYFGVRFTVPLATMLLRRGPYLYDPVVESTPLETVALLREWDRESEFRGMLCAIAHPDLAVRRRQGQRLYMGAEGPVPVMVLPVHVGPSAGSRLRHVVATAGATGRRRDRLPVDPHETLVTDAIDRGPGSLFEERCQRAAGVGRCGAVDRDQIDPQFGKGRHAAVFRQSIEAFHRFHESARFGAAESVYHSRPVVVESSM